MVLLLLPPRIKSFLQPHQRTPKSPPHHNIVSGVGSLTTRPRRVRNRGNLGMRFMLTRTVIRLRRVMNGGRLTD